MKKLIFGMFLGLLAMQACKKTSAITETTIDAASLPAKVTEYLANNYPDAAITSASELKSGKAAHIVGLDNHQEIAFDRGGDPIDGDGDDFHGDNDGDGDADHTVATKTAATATTTTITTAATTTTDSPATTTAATTATATTTTAMSFPWIRFRRLLQPIWPPIMPVIPRNTPKPTPFARSARSMRWLFSRIQPTV